MTDMKILAIETSCDETAAAVIDEVSGAPVVLSNVVSSQIDIHAKYGGVVPEVAARAHMESMLHIITQALVDAKLTLSEIDYLAVTDGPGLIGSLVVGVETVKGLSAATGIPAIGVNHLEGHVYANFLDKKQPEFPLLTLLVSGGHTQLIYLEDHLRYQIVGQTWDDAAGEAFDKAARALGLPYPGGPVISKIASAGKVDAFDFPVVDLTAPPKRGEDGFLEYSLPSCDFSFSGLKTSLITTVKKGVTKEEIKDVAASFESTVVETLVQNTLRAIEQYRPKSFFLSGGVAANKKLRESLTSAVLEKEVAVFLPKPEFCTDNAAMIGAAAYFHLKHKKESALRKANPNAKL